jgi:hypothetical protein
MSGQDLMSSLEEENKQQNGNRNNIELNVVVDVVDTIELPV